MNEKYEHRLRVKQSAIRFLTSSANVALFTTIALDKTASSNSMSMHSSHNRISTRKVQESLVSQVCFLTDQCLLDITGILSTVNSEQAGSREGSRKLNISPPTHPPPVTSPVASSLVQVFAAGLPISVGVLIIMTTRVDRSKPDETLALIRYLE